MVHCRACTRCCHEQAVAAAVLAEVAAVAGVEAEAVVAVGVAAEDAAAAEAKQTKRG